MYLGDISIFISTNLAPIC